MPELPEVETVKNGLAELVKGQQIKSIQLKSPKLRNTLSKKIPSPFKGKTILGLQRRAKYILFETDDFYLINHLGMTGNWRDEKLKSKLKKHDHVVINLDNKSLIYNDPRRFGILDYCKKTEIDKNKSGMPL